MRDEPHSAHGPKDVWGMRLMARYTIVACSSRGAVFSQQDVKFFGLRCEAVVGLLLLAHHLLHLRLERQQHRGLGALGLLRIPHLLLRLIHGNGGLTKIVLPSGLRRLVLLELLAKVTAVLLELLGTFHLARKPLALGQHIVVNLVALFRPAPVQLDVLVDALFTPRPLTLAWTLLDRRDARARGVRQRGGRSIHNGGGSGAWRTGTLNEIECILLLSGRSRRLLDAARGTVAAHSGSRALR
mmetsp:Transcript_18357/g.26912  ORF Transcript_18357/g.26912 Transcript_18357/m.26912 type:complete len:242 (+) Transcript_18357:231-956(+)